MDYVATLQALAKQHEFFIGVDSGPAHMANAWRRPALLLFGHFAGRDTWCPYEGLYAEREADVILRHPGPLAQLGAETVIARLHDTAAWRALQSRNSSILDDHAD